MTPSQQWLLGMTMVREGSTREQIQQRLGVSKETATELVRSWRQFYRHHPERIDAQAGQA